MMLKKINRIITHVFAVMFGMAGMLVSVCASAQEESLIMRDIQISEQPDHIVIHVNFNNPVQMIRHFPPNAGEILYHQNHHSASIG